MDSTKVKIEGGYLSPKMTSYDSMGTNDASSEGETGSSVIFKWTPAGFTAIQGNYQGCPYFNPFETDRVKEWIDKSPNPDKNNLFVALFLQNCATIT